MDASLTTAAPIEAEVSPKVDLRGYVTLDQIPASLRGKVLASVASQVVIEPNPAAFEGQELDNGGLFFQNGKINGPGLDLASRSDFKFRRRFVELDDSDAHG